MSTPRAHTAPDQLTQGIFGAQKEKKPLFAPLNTQGNNTTSCTIFDAALQQPLGRFGLLASQTQEVLCFLRQPASSFPTMTISRVLPSPRHKSVFVSSLIRQIPLQAQTTFGPPLSPLLARRLLAQSTFGAVDFWPRPLLARAPVDHPQCQDFTRRRPVLGGVQSPFLLKAGNVHLA